MSRALTVVLVVVVVLAVAIILALRWPPEAHGAEGISDALVQTAMQNIRAHNAKAEYKPIGTVSDVTKTIATLTEDTEFLLAYSDGALRPVAIKELLNNKKIGSGYKTDLANIFAKTISEGDDIYQISVNGKTTHMTVSKDARRSSGLLPSASRLPGIAYTVERQKNCTRKVLSRNIFGQDAELITVCTEATCSGKTPSRCEISEINSRSSFFGTVKHTPENPPKSGEVFDNYCRGVAHYKWVIAIGGISIPEFGKIEISNFSFGGQGNVISEVHCKS